MKSFITLLSIIFIFHLKLNAQVERCDYPYVLLGNDDNYLIEKTKSKVTITVPYFRSEKQKSKKSQDEIVEVKPQPGNTACKFNLVNQSFEINSIRDLEIFSVKDLSKNDERIWKQYPYFIYFIEKINDSKYSVYKMRPEMNE